MYLQKIQYPLFKVSIVCSNVTVIFWSNIAWEIVSDLGNGQPSPVLQFNVALDVYCLMFLVCGLTKTISPDFCCPCSLETVLEYENLSPSLFQAFIKFLI